MPKGTYDCSKAKKKPSQREQILAAAIEVYARYGFEGATIERMAGAAGVSKTLVSAHFGGKQGLVREIANLAVSENLARMQAIDRRPGMTLRQREKRIFSSVKKSRDQWRLVYGTLLVPQFQFELRPIIDDYMKTEHKNILAYLHEFKEPTKDEAQAFSYAMLALRQQYVLDGREAAFRRAQSALFDAFLLPEQA